MKYLKWLWEDMRYVYEWWEITIMLGGIATGFAGGVLLGFHLFG